METIDLADTLRRAQKHVRQHHYASSAQNCGALVETGLRQLYFDLESYCDQRNLTKDFEELNTAFFKSRNRNFDVRNAGLGGMILFVQHTDFWTILKQMCESNLSYLSMVNWHRVRMLRNKAVHGGRINRQEAREMIFYTKVFLYDTGLVEGRAEPEVFDLHCPRCSHSVKDGFNFCPGCGSELIRICNTCMKDVRPQYKICPHCDTSLADRPGEESANKFTFRENVKGVWADWEVTPAERAWLEQRRLELGLTPREAEQIEASVIPESYRHFMNLIDAVNIDGVIDEDEYDFLMGKRMEFNIPEITAETLIENTRQRAKVIRQQLLRVK